MLLEGWFIYFYYFVFFGFYCVLSICLVPYFTENNCVWIYLYALKKQEDENGIFDVYDVGIYTIGTSFESSQQNISNI